MSQNHYGRMQMIVGCHHEICHLLVQD